jgi:hypothetical protein
MQVDAAPEENDNIEEEPQYVVENPSLVSKRHPYVKRTKHIALTCELYCHLMQNIFPILPIKI